ncbi:MAG: hypothetical protein KBA66_19250 [Leptospiraceae bacterium]|nr:hypothetical protein [Leptospiraceae bacterium]
MKFFISLLFLYSVCLYAEPTTLRQEEKDELKYIDAMRAKGFSDRILDRLHKSIALNITRIKDLAEKNYLKNGYRYLQHEPVDESIISKNELFFTDKENKLYFRLDLGQGVTNEDYPNRHIFDTKAFVYLNEDGKSLSKIIFQFTRVNTTGTTYVKEVRRIINPTPNSPEPIKLEGEKVNDVKKIQEENIVDESVASDTNNDIVIEYFSGHDKNLPLEEPKLANETTPSKTPSDPSNPSPKTEAKEKEPARDPNYKAKDLPWINEKPEMANLASMKNRLNDPNELLPYSSQKHVMDTYRVVLKVLNREIERKVKAIELNQRIIIKKMTEINF